MRSKYFRRLCSSCLACFLAPQFTRAHRFLFVMPGLSSITSSAEGIILRLLPFGLHPRVRRSLTKFRRGRGWTLIAGVLLPSASGLAHHGASAYDQSRTVTFDATVSGQDHASRRRSARPALREEISANEYDYSYARASTGSLRLAIHAG